MDRTDRLDSGVLLRRRLCRHGVAWVARSAVGLFFAWLAVVAFRQTGWNRVAGAEPGPSPQQTVVNYALRADRHPDAEANPRLAEEPADGFARAVATWRSRAASEPDLSTKAEMLASAAALERLEAQSRQLHAEVEAAKARAKALEPGPARLIGHFLSMAALAVPLSGLLLHVTWRNLGTSSLLWTALGLLAGAALLPAGLYIGAKAFAPQSERLRFARSLPRWLAPVRPSLLVILFALALVIAMAI